MDESVQFRLEWKINSISLNTTVAVNIEPKHGLRVSLEYPEVKLIEKELEQACSRIHSIMYKELS